MPISRTTTGRFPWIPAGREGFPIQLGMGIGRRVPALLVRARPFDGPGADYWDYVLCDRGLLFAPVCIDLRYVRRGWHYTPCYVVHDTWLLGALFVRDGCGCCAGER